jgi:uncharacterized membrane protein YccC
MRWPRDLLGVATPDVARGVRAAFVTLAPFYLAAALTRPELGWTALGGWLGTLADPGGPRPTRAKALAVFALAGAPLVALFETLARTPGVATAAIMLVAFAMSLLRATSGSAATLGNFLTMIAAIGGGRVRHSPAADALAFGLGATLAVLVSSIVWPVWTHLPVRRAVANVYDELAAYLEDAARLALPAEPAAPSAWTDLARRHHRQIRAAIESARATALAGRARRQGETRFGGSIRALLGAAELQFPILSSLVIELESSTEAPAVDASRLEAIATMYRAVAATIGSPDIRRRSARLPPASAANPAPATSVADHLVDRLERASSLVRGLVGALAFGGDDDALGVNPDAASGSAPPPAARTASPAPPNVRLPAALRAIRDALSFRSPFLHHAVRTALAVGIASFTGELLSRSRVYWVTLTTLAILQPYPGATMKRAGERVVGTVLGCVLALVITTTVRSPLALSLLLVPLSIAAVATRPRSYRLFTFFLTPLFVIITDPAHDWHTAALRAGDAVLGGTIALLAGVLIVPASERRRAPEALFDMLSALGEYAAAVFASFRDPTGAVDAAHVAAKRRAVGIAFGAAETSLERWLAEPLTDRGLAADAMLLVTYARRLGSALTSLDVLRPIARAQSPTGTADAAPVAAYVAAVLEAAKAHVTGAPSPTIPPGPWLHPPAEPSLEQGLERVIRWTALVAGVAQRDLAAET